MNVLKKIFFIYIMITNVCVLHASCGAEEESSSSSRPTASTRSHEESLELIKKTFTDHVKSSSFHMIPKTSFTVKQFTFIPHSYEVIYKCIENPSLTPEDLVISAYNGMPDEIFWPVLRVEWLLLSQLCEGKKQAICYLMEFTVKISS